MGAATALRLRAINTVGRNKLHSEVIRYAASCCGVVPTSGHCNVLLLHVSFEVLVHGWVVVRFHALLSAGLLLLVDNFRWGWRLRPRNKVRIFLFMPVVLRYAMQYLGKIGFTVARTW